MPPPSEGHMLKLLVVADQVMFHIPHDEAPLRVFLYCEVLAKAFSQVRMRMCACVPLCGVGGCEL